MDSKQDTFRLTQFFSHSTTLAVIILTVLWVIFFWRLWTPTVEDRVIFQQGDFPLHYFAYSDYQVERMMSGEIPLWNPYNYGGDPFAANVQWAVWYPPRWIAALVTGLVAGSDGWGIEALQFEVAAHYWLISLMMYAFLRVVFHIPHPPPPSPSVERGSQVEEPPSSQAVRAIADSVGVIHELPLQTRFLTAFPALLGAILGAAEGLRVREELENQWSRDGSDFAEQAKQRVRGSAAKAWRFIGEMEEIAATFKEAGMPGGFHTAAADIYRRMDHFKGLKSPPSIEGVLVDLLKAGGRGEK